MRHLGTLPDQSRAQTFVDYVLVRGVKAKVERDGDGPSGGWAVWVFDEDSLPVAKEEFAQFQQNPNDPKYGEVAAQAAVVRADERRRAEAARKRQVQVRDRWNRPLSAQIPVTMLVSGLCLAITLASDFGARVEPLVTWLSFARVRDGGDGSRYLSLGESTFSAIFQGELWRLVTPIFLHFTPMHLVGNLYWTFYLGTRIEMRRGWKRYLGLLLALAVFSNLVQALFVGPFFGGISGVTHGLFGYIWMRSRYDPESGFMIDPLTVVIFLSWFVLCFTPLVGDIANGAHWGGLFLGMIIGYWPKLWRDLR